MYPRHVECSCDSPAKNFSPATSEYKSKLPDFYRENLFRASWNYLWEDQFLSDFAPDALKMGAMNRLLKTSVDLA